MWNEFRTMKRTLQPKMDLRLFYNTLIDRTGGHPEARSQFGTEFMFHTDQCPYYCVHRSIADGLSKITLDVDCTLFKLPKRVLEFKFKIPNWRGIRAILACELFVKETKAIGVFVDCGELYNGFPLNIFSVFKLEENKKVSEMVEETPMNGINEEEHKILFTAIKLVLAVCLIDQDDPMIQPDVLTADKAKLNPENSGRLAAKAHKRGKYGWVLGDDRNEMSPHYRASHFAIRWTGKGKTTPKLVQVKATTVHRKKVVAVPTGIQKED